MPGRIPRPLAPGDSSDASKSICIPMQMPRNGRLRLDRLVGEVVEPVRAQRLHAPPEGTDAGEHDAVGVADRARGRR